jgi:hypothetical protein
MTDADGRVIRWILALIVGIFLMTAYDTDAIYHAVQFIHGL